MVTKRACEPGLARIGKSGDPSPADIGETRLVSSAGDALPYLGLERFANADHTNRLRLDRHAAADRRRGNQ